MKTPIATQASIPERPTPLPELFRDLAEGVAFPSIEIADLTLDSRAVRPGSLFVALAGGRNHGIDFAPQAAAQGASAVVFEPGPANVPTLAQNVPLIAVPKLRSVLGAVADRFFAMPSAHMSVAAVTGTNGKTTSAYLIAAALTALRKPAGYAGTLGYGPIGALRHSVHTTADCITVHRQLAEMRAEGDECVGMEVSSHALDQGRIDGVRVHSALFTNLTRDHLDYHGTIEAYGAAKERLFLRPELKCYAVNVDDDFGRQMLARLARQPQRGVSTAYSARNERPSCGDRQLFARDVEMTARGIAIEVDGSWKTARLESSLIGAFNVENLLGVLAVLLGMDVPLERAVEALAHCGPPPGRMETLKAAGRPLVVIDYAHTPDALDKALATARSHTRGRVICVFGCGGDRDGGKRPLMGEIAEQRADLVIVTDDNPRTEDGDSIVADILQGMSRPGAALVERDRARAIARAIEAASADDLVLIAGKGHEDYQIVGRNVRHFSDRETAARSLELRS